MRNFNEISLINIQIVVWTDLVTNITFQFSTLSADAKTWPIYLLIAVPEWSRMSWEIWRECQNDDIDIFDTCQLILNRCRWPNLTRLHIEDESYILDFDFPHPRIFYEFSLRHPQVKELTTDIHITLNHPCLAFPKLEKYNGYIEELRGLTAPLPDGERFYNVVEFKK